MTLPNSNTNIVEVFGIITDLNERSDFVKMSLIVTETTFKPVLTRVNVWDKDMVKGLKVFDIIKIRYAEHGHFKRAKELEVVDEKYCEFCGKIGQTYCCDKTDQSKIIFFKKMIVKWNKAAQALYGPARRVGMKMLDDPEGKMYFGSFFSSNPHYESFDGDDQRKNRIVWIFGNIHYQEDDESADRLERTEKSNCVYIKIVDFIPADMGGSLTEAGDDEAEHSRIRIL